MRHLWLLLMLACTTVLHASSTEDSVNAFIAAEMPSSKTPGLAYAVVQAGEITGDERGVLDAEGNTPVLPNTPFILGSVSKSFTALAVMQMVETEKLGLDDPIAKHLAVFADTEAESITIRQLLSHTSGYSMLQGNQTQNDFSMDNQALNRRVNTLVAQGPSNPIGSKWEYSNGNYQILGLLVETVSGQDYASYMQANVLQPIGMTDSFVHGAGAHPKMANGHQPWFGTKRPLSKNMTGRGSIPQGGIVASARDLARYLAVMMNGQDDVISAEGKALMMSPASDVSPDYGFGWFVDIEQGTVSHSGSNPGYEALATMVPAEQKAVAIVINAGSGTGFGLTTELRYGIAARALDIEYSGEGSALPGKAAFILTVLAPLLFILSMIWAWRKRGNIRAKSGWFGKFSLWFPLFTTVCVALIVFVLVPQLFGAPLSAIHAFQPDIGLALITTAVMGVVWAAFRLAVAYSGKVVRG